MLLPTIFLFSFFITIAARLCYKMFICMRDVCSITGNDDIDNKKKNKNEIII